MRSPFRRSAGTQPQGVATGSEYSMDSPSRIAVGLRTPGHLPVVYRQARWKKKKKPAGRTADWLVCGILLCAGAGMDKTIGRK